MGSILSLEAKNNSTNDRISRSEIEQLLHSIQWHNDKYGSDQKYIPIMLHRSSKSFENVHPSDDSRVMNETLLNQLKDALLSLGKALSQKPPQSWSVTEVQTLLSSYGLLYNQLVEKYTIPLR